MRYFFFFKKSRLFRKMPIVNDSIIVGVIIVLVFGALFYYLYTRVLINEKRMVVMENIVLDLKHATESFFGSITTGDTFEEEVTSQPLDNHHTQHDFTIETVGEENREDTTSFNVEDVSLSNGFSNGLSNGLSNEETSKEETQKTNQTVNYESFNIKELHNEASLRNISGSSKMKRKELIENLKLFDTKKAEQTIDSLIESN